MHPPVHQPVTPSQYRNLLDWAAQAPDFVFLGSRATHGDRGGWQGFSAMGTDHLTVPGNHRGAMDVTVLIDRMEAACTALGGGQEFDGPAVSSGPITGLKGGWVGTLSYEFGYALEPHLTACQRPLPCPLLDARLYLWMASQNSHTGDCMLWRHPQLPSHIAEQLEAAMEGVSISTADDWRMIRPFEPEQSAEAFRERVRRIQDYIVAGDCYQTNLSQQFTGHYEGDPWQAFSRLTQANPTPYAAFLRLGGQTVMSVSPERFLAIENGILETSPIKGTRPRGTTPESDLALSEELQRSEKDRAENLMIVDLLRNDLGRNAVAGSVQVDKLFALESYENVHHLVSHIRATLKPGVSPLKALVDAFPGGSITGAPKRRAMEIIRQLEPHWRGPYCGSVFRYDLDGNLDSSIAIRTLLCGDDGQIHCWGGGGIVADSDPEAEYQETLTKVRPLMAFLEQLGNR
ncbi:MAG TPA: aminodeoxychorismate synthase component I [Marinobacter sp.]|nr:aminodeoxychorismate synthase component I [Marinobacter sp.]